MSNKDILHKNKDENIKKYKKVQKDLQLNTTCGINGVNGKETTQPKSTRWCKNVFKRRGIIMKKMVSVLMAAVLACGLAGCGSSETASQTQAPAAGTETTGAAAASGESYSFKLATDAALDYPTTQGLQKFADEVLEKSGGRIKIEIYPSGQLGDENAYLQQLQFGAVDFAKSSVAPLAQFCNDLNALSLPYLFDSTEHMFKVLDGGLGQEIFDSFEEANIIGLGYTNNGSRCFFTKKPVQKADDLANMKLRVQSSPMMMGLVESLGGFPQAIASTELYSALQTGVVDGAENNINTYYNDSLYEQAPYFIKDHHNIQPEIIIASKMTWDRLSEEDQQIIRDAMKVGMDYQREVWLEAEKKSEEALTEAGVTFYEATEEQIGEFREKCQAMYENAELGKPYEEFVQKVRAVQ